VRPDRLGEPPAAPRLGARSRRDHAAAADTRGRELVSTVPSLRQADPRAATVVWLRPHRRAGRRQLVL